MWLWFGCRTAAVAVFVTGLLTFAPAIASVGGDPGVEGATTVVEVFIETDEVRVELETGVPDLVVFNRVFPDEFRVRMGLEPEPDDERRRRFFSEDFVILDHGGRPLPGRVERFETRHRTPPEELIGESPAAARARDEPVVFTVFSYPLEGRPEHLTIRPPAANGHGRRADIGLMTYHLGLPVMDFSPLTGEETVDLDWDDPWRTGFRNPAFRRRSDCPLSVSLHVERTEVRVEIMVRPWDLQAWADVGIDGAATIPVAMQDEVAARAAAFLESAFELKIDDTPVRPELDRVGFLSRTLRQTTVIEPPSELNTAAAMLGVVFSHSPAENPQRVRLSWKLFSDDHGEIPAAVADDRGARRSLLRSGAGELGWESPETQLRAPTLADVAPPPSTASRVLAWLSWAVLVGAGFLALRAVARAAGGAGRWATAAVLLVAACVAAAGARSATWRASLSEARAAEIVTAVLHDIYRTFDHRDEDAVVAALERSVSKELATTIACDLGRQLDRAGRDGRRARAFEIELDGLSSRPTDTGLTARCAWIVTTTVGHWGHVHHRNSRFEGVLTLEDCGSRWQVTGFEVIDEHPL